jgi:hypothetical protein
MGVESTELDPDRWLAVDAGATRIRVAPIVFSGQAQRIGPVQQSVFDSLQGASRVALAARLVQSVAESAGWKAPYRLGIAWAGAPGPEGKGTVAARYGPAIPDLIDQLSALLPLGNAPSLHSDARAALEGAALMHGFSSAYALISGSGLGEAYLENGHSWSREQFQSRLGRACDWLFSGLDGETWLRAESWRHQPPQQPVAALRALLDHRLEQVQPQVVALGGHFRDWFERGWISVELAQLWWSRPALYIEPELALLGCVQMERKLTSAGA